MTPSSPPPRPPWRGLGIKLFLSYLAVVAFGFLVLSLAATLVAPPLFVSHMAQMRRGGPGHMMGPGGMGWQGAMPPGAAMLDDVASAAFATSLRQALLLAGAAGVLAALAASFFVTSRIVGPVRRMAAASQRLAAGHYHERVATASDDELGDLAASFNELAGALEATERRRQELIGDVAHEMRTPIATLQGYLEGLLDGVVDPDQRLWARLLDEAGRLHRLVSDLQELSRAEARQIPLALRAVSPAEIVQAATDRLAPQFSEKGLDLAIDLPASLPPVWADHDRGVQVLSNLLSNALRYTPAPGWVKLSARPRENAVEFTVTDSGIGIAPEHLPHVFERFYRVDKSRSRALGGAGVGLTIARALVEAMGGTIAAESPGPGRGATFRFTLPIARGGAPSA